MKYFSQLKKFISVPIGFHGVVDSSDSIFASIVDWYVKITIIILFKKFNYGIFIFTSNAPKFAKLFLRAENLFEKLEDVLKEWESRVALGSIDIEKMIQETIKTAHDWEVNFRSSKSWGQQIAKLNW